MGPDAVEKAVTILTHWINTEFLTQEPESKSNAGFYDLKELDDWIGRSKLQAADSKRNTLITVEFGQIDVCLFMRYFLERHKKVAPCDMPRIDFPGTGCISFAKKYYLYDQKDGIWKESVQYSPLFVADHHLLIKGKISELDSQCYERFVFENPDPIDIYRKELNRIVRYCRTYIKDFDLDPGAVSYDARVNRKNVVSSTPPCGMDNNFIHDLELLRNLIIEGSYGNTPYEETVIKLILNDQAVHEDIIRNDNRERVRELFEKYLDISMAPAGKWKVRRKRSYSPYLMQQLAINMFCNDAAPVFSVNGPPGTGKSTLIKEVIAELITKKVKLMADHLKANDYDPDSFFFNVNEELWKYSIVVASSTNTAVENILDNDSNKLFTAMLGNTSNVRTFLNYLEDMMEDEKSEEKKPEGKGNNWKENRIKQIKAILRKDIRKLTDEYLSLYSEISDERKKLAGECRENVDGLMGKFFDERSYYEAQTSNPYNDGMFDSKREQLFNLACDLHILVAWKSDHINKSRKNKERLDFDTLFYRAPVIGATFASVGRMFSGDDRIRFGVLISDESGQVLPQNAAGALMRAGKALIVGDPKQIPPVVPASALFAYEFTRPRRGRARVCGGGHESYNETGIAGMASLQEYADGVNPYGTFIDGTWVGCPLVVHSRCISPMFEISNMMSYDGNMINMTKMSSKEDEAGFIMDDSCWIQVKGKESGGEKNRFVRRQADVVIKMIEEKCKKIGKKGKGDLDLFVISPFVSVAVGLRNYIKDYIVREEQRGRSGKSLDLMNKWINDKKTKSIGTIHTFQGQEAGEVIFLLGCDKGSIRSAEWIFKNMVNVAASRAKYRLYIVGDMDLFRCKKGNDEKDESPVNTARKIIMHRNPHYRISLKELNATLDATKSVAERRERLHYTCPLCGSDVIKGPYGWFCKNKTNCDMEFKLYGVPLNSTTMRRLLLQKKDTWFHLVNEIYSRYYHLYPDKIVHTPKGSFYAEQGYYDKPWDGWYPKPKYGKDSDMLECNISGMARWKIDYFDRMILDAIYTSIRAGKKQDPSSYDIFKLLSGMSRPEPRSAVRLEIESRLHRLKMTKVMNRERTLMMPYKLIDGRDSNGKFIFPNTVKWLKIKYYILYRISYMYTVKMTSNHISLKKMKIMLCLSDEDASRPEKKRFRDRLKEYMDFLVRESYIRETYRIEPAGKNEEGYLGIKTIVINS